MPLTARKDHPAAQVSEGTAREIAQEAYIYAYPLVLMELTRRTMTNVALPEDGKGPMNRFGHKKAFPDARFTDVVRANADTLYSMLWFDVSAEPLVIHVPDSGGRYHLLPMLDMWTDVFASPGSRTTGDEAQEFAITGPKWRGPPLRHVTEIRSPTEQGWMLGRTQTNGKFDYTAVHRFQSGLTAVPATHYGKVYTPEKSAIDTRLDMSAPVEQVAKMDPAAFFSLFARVSRANPPHANDYPVLARMARLGLEPGKTFNLAAASPEARKALEEAPKAARKKIASELARTARILDGWTMPSSPIGTYGADYLRRAAVAYNGLGANTMEDAVYPSMLADADGSPLDSARSYVLRFEKGCSPPARAFWSLTMYDERQFFTQNPIERYAIGDRDKLAWNEDGSLDLYIQRDVPDAAKQANWLPAPAQGSFSLTMRLYWPKPEALDGTWQPPALKRVA
jgi:hypothetical protein